jgi:hypothetical protein
MNTPLTSPGAAEPPDHVPHQTDGRTAATDAGERAAEAEAVRRAEDRPSHPAVDGEQSEGRRHTSGPGG